MNEVWIGRRSMVGETDPRHVDQREELGVGKALAEHFEHLLAAAHAGEPVVDERQRVIRVACRHRRRRPAPTSP